MATSDRPHPTSAAQPAAAPLAPQTGSVAEVTGENLATSAENQSGEPSSQSTLHADAKTGDPNVETSVPTATGDQTSQPAPATQNGDDVTRGSSTDVDTSKPKDFDGAIATTNDLPSPETLKKIEDYVVLDGHGKSHTFKSLYKGRNAARRVLVIFVRHFFCGNCQEYLRTLAESITTEALLGLPVSTFITVIGCGDPGLIKMYADDTKCPFPIYTDPTRRLFSALGMTRTWDLGSRPAYMRKSMFHSTAASIFQGLKQIPTGLATKSGDQKQVGGEFLFEPHDIATPISTPNEEVINRSLGDAIAKQRQQQQQQQGKVQEGQTCDQDEDGAQQTEGESGHKRSGQHAVDEEEDHRVEEKSVTWCHRMRTTRDHAEIPELMEVLGLDGNGKPIQNLKLWAKAVQERKGTGLSMASQMSRLNQQ